MAAITVNAANINPLNHESTERLSFIAAEAITAGQWVYLLATGKVGVGGIGDTGKKTPLGIALKSCGAGQACGVQLRGLVSGLNVSSLDAGALVYTAAAGALADATATGATVIGKVVSLTDASLTKVVYLAIPQNVANA